MTARLIGVATDDAAIPRAVWFGTSGDKLPRVGDLYEALDGRGRIVTRTALAGDLTPDSMYIEADTNAVLRWDGINWRRPPDSAEVMALHRISEQLASIESLLGRVLEK